MNVDVSLPNLATARQCKGSRCILPLGFVIEDAPLSINKTAIETRDLYQPPVLASGVFGMKLHRRPLRALSPKGSRLRPVHAPCFFQRYLELRMFRTCQPLVQHFLNPAHIVSEQCGWIEPKPREYP